MTKDELESCRMAAIKVRELVKEFRVMKKSADSIRSVTYSDVPRQRGEPLSPEQAHVERCEEKESKIRDAKYVWQQKKDSVIREFREHSLTRLQKALLIGYYVYGCKDWDEVNQKCNVSREQSKYQVRLALEKLFKNP